MNDGFEQQLHYSLWKLLICDINLGEWKISVYLKEKLMLNLWEGWGCILDSVAGHKPLALQFKFESNWFLLMYITFCLLVCLLNLFIRDINKESLRSTFSQMLQDTWTICMALHDKYNSIIIFYKCFNAILSNKLAYWFMCNSLGSCTVKENTAILERCHIFFVLNKLYNFWISKIFIQPWEYMFY